jgi:hypothetical protein
MDQRKQAIGMAAILGAVVMSLAVLYSLSSSGMGSNPPGEHVLRKLKESLRHDRR